MTTCDTPLDLSTGIKVCDAIMGTGKTEAAIAYINEHPDQKYIYVAPYKGEAARIKRDCPDLHFVEPSDEIPQFCNSKVQHSKWLIEQNRNIASTHVALGLYTKEMLDMIREKEYTLIIDEAITSISTSSLRMHTCDLQMMINAGNIVVKEDGRCEVNPEYTGWMLDEIRELAKNKTIYCDKERKGKDSDPVSKEGNKSVFFVWEMDPALFTSFKSVFILTYLFSAQGVHHMFKLHNIDYTYIHVERVGTASNGAPLCRFTDKPGYIPEYVPRLKEMIEIYQNPTDKNSGRLNDIGDDDTALSKSWFESSKRVYASSKTTKTLKGEAKTRVRQTGITNFQQLKNNVYNYFRHVCDTTPSGDVATSDDRLWGAFPDKEQRKLFREGPSPLTPLDGKGYKYDGLVYNARATNEYNDRTILAYCVNIYMNVNEKHFFESRGVAVDQDKYALSTMVQWIWRSAIRKGQPIKIYIPSSRMRRLLEEWIEQVSKGENLVA